MANPYSKIIKKNTAEIKADTKGANKVVKAIANTANKSIDASAKRASEVAYVRHNMAKGELKSNDLYSETTKNKLTTNLAKGVASANAQKKEGRDIINAAKEKAKAKNTTNYYTTKMKSNYELRTKRKEYTDKRAAEKMDVFTKTISRYDSKKKAQKAIKALKKSKDPQKAQKIAYIQKQMADLRAQKKAEKAARSGGGRGYYRRYGGYYRRYGGWRNYGSGSDAYELPDVKVKETPTVTEKPKKNKASTTHVSASGKVHGGGGGKISPKATYTKSVARKREYGRRHWHL